MTNMDLEGIAALAAVVVALIGIPATILIGRWQMKAALRTAEATSEAGLAQAEAAYRAGVAQADAAYRAALDAVGAEADAAHLQWRRGIQRETYASFLLAANRVKKVGERFVMDNEGDLSTERIRSGKAAIDDALENLKAAQTIVELEGPEDVADPAATMTIAAEMMGYYLGKQAIYERAWGKLGRIMNDPSASVSDTAVGLMQALADLSRLRSTSTSDSEGSGEQNAHAPRAAERSCHDARNALPPDVLDDEEFSALMEGWRSYPPTSSNSYSEAVRQFDGAETRFVRAAKVQLHDQVAP